MLTEFGGLIKLEPAVDTYCIDSVQGSLPHANSIIPPPTSLVPVIVTSLVTVFVPQTPTHGSTLIQVSHGQMLGRCNFSKPTWFIFHRFCLLVPSHHEHTSRGTVCTHVLLCFKKPHNFVFCNKLKVFFETVYLFNFQVCEYEF